MIATFLADLGPWSWFLAATVLLILELMLPGTFMLWLGLAAAATGLVALLLEWVWQAQVTVFASLAIVFVFLGRHLAHSLAPGGDTDSFLNRRAEALVGREFTLADPMTNGAGQVRVDDSVWRVTGPDAPAGTRIRVNRIDGSVLEVTPV